MLSLALVVAAAGFGQFGVLAALADVASEFGTVVEGEDMTLAERAGLSGTPLGVGLAIIRLASAASFRSQVSPIVWAGGGPSSAWLRSVCSSWQPPR